MREEGGLGEIKRAIDKLSRNHLDHLKVYDPKGGDDNRRRLTGVHDVPSFDDFSVGVANRFCTVRIPRAVEIEKKGYLEDRRPSSNCDPYLVSKHMLQVCQILHVSVSQNLVFQVTRKIVQTCCLEQ